MRKVTLLERRPGVHRVRIETKDMEGKRVYRYETFYGTAEEAEIRRRELLKEGDPNPISHEKNTTFHDYAKYWVSRRLRLGEIAPQTADWYERILEYAMPLLGDKEMRKIGQRDIEEVYVAMLSPTLDRDPLSPRSVLHLHGRLGSLWKSAVDEEVVAVNVMLKVRAPKLKNRYKVETLSAKDVERLLGKVEDDVGGIGSVIRFALSTGCRRGEIVALQWGDINWEEGVVYIKRNAIDLPGGHVRIDTPKTAAGVRRIVLPQGMLNELKMLYEYRIGEWVFAKRDGGMRNPNAVSGQVNRVLNEIGLERFSLHDLRHAHATMLLQRKHSPKAVARRLGHSDVTITLQTYAHAMPEDDAGMASDMNSIMGYKAAAE